MVGVCDVVGVFMIVMKCIDWGVVCCLGVDCIDLRVKHSMCCLFFVVGGVFVMMVLVVLIVVFMYCV